MRRLKSAALASMLLAACGAEGTHVQGGPASLLIMNESQFDLLEVRKTTGANYQGAANLAGGTLPVNASFVSHGSGDWWVTVLRIRYEGGPIVALTTKEPLELEDGNGYELIVFDESFRLEPSDLVPED
jgi:hypothetical protein